MKQLVSVYFIRTDELSCKTGIVFFVFFKKFLDSTLYADFMRNKYFCVGVELFFVVVSFNSFSFELYFWIFSLSTNSSYTLIVLSIFGSLFFISVNSIRAEELSCGSGIVSLFSFYIFIVLHTG